MYCLRKGGKGQNGGKGSLYGKGRHEGMGKGFDDKGKCKGGWWSRLVWAVTKGYDYPDVERGWDGEEEVDKVSEVSAVHREEVEQSGGTVVRGAPGILWRLGRLSIFSIEREGKRIGVQRGR
jgi:hypothetical protein